MKQRTLIVGLVLGLAGVLAGCSADSPTAPKTTPTPTMYSITLESSASSAEVKTGILLTVRVTQGGQNAPDNTSVTFSLHGCPGVGATLAGAPTFENGLCQVVSTTSGGVATAWVFSSTATTWEVSAIVRGQIISKTIRFFEPVNPRSLAIYSIVPDEGSPAGGERATIYGRGFAQPLAVTFLVGGYDRSAQVVEVNAAGTQMVVITPKKPLETSENIADITVVAGVGTESEVSETAEKIFTYTSPLTPGGPAIYSIVPSEGLDKGGEQVTVYGANFYSPTVKFGDENVQVVSTSSDHSTILLLTPKHSRAAGSTGKEYVTVRITTAGDQTVERSNGWAWVPPTTEPGAPVLYSANPNKGSPRGGQEVTLRGANLCNAFDSITKKCIAAPTVTFNIDGYGERTASVLSFSDDGSSIVVITPSVSPNPVLTDVNASITVTNPQGSATLSFQYTYLGEAGDPEIFSISPNKGSARGGDTVMIYGKYFLAPVQVQFSQGGLAVVLEVSADKTEITIRVPAASILPLTEDTYSDVTVTTQAGTGRDKSATLSRGYLFLADEPTPELFALSPNSGPVDGGTRVTITGQGFQYPVQVYFGDRQAQVISNNFNQVICVTPSITVSQPGTPTNVEVTVLNTATGKRSNAVTFRYGEAMFLSAISPNHGPADEETTVTIHGQGFVGPVEVVTIAEERIQANVLSVSGTQIIAKIQPLPAGRRDCGIVAAAVEVTNLTSNIKATGVTFHYESPTPLITSVEITASSKAGNDNTVPQYNPGSSYGSCSTNSNWGNYKVTVRGSNFQKTGNDSSMVISIPGVTAELPTTYVSANELWFMLPDLTGVGMQEISCIAGTGTCGLVFVQTPVALTVKNLRSNCSDTLGGAIVIVPCDQRCREVPAIDAIDIVSAGPYTVGQPLAARVTLTSAPEAGTNVVVRLTYAGFEGTPAEVTVPGGLASATFLFTVTPTLAGTGTIIAETGTGPCTRVAQTTPLITVQPALTITTTSPLAAGTVGVAYSQSLAATGGATPYTWTMTGSPINGLSLSGSVVTGTPAAAGTFLLPVTVTDADLRTAQRDFTVVIAAAAP